MAASACYSVNRSACFLYALNARLACASHASKRGGRHRQQRQPPGARCVLLISSGCSMCGGCAGSSCEEPPHVHHMMCQAPEPQNVAHASALSPYTPAARHHNSATVTIHTFSTSTPALHMITHASLTLGNLHNLKTRQWTHARTQACRSSPEMMPLPHESRALPRCARQHHHAHPARYSVHRPCDSSFATCSIPSASMMFTGK